MLIFKHRVKPFGEPSEAVCGVIVKTSRYLVQSAERVTCPLCKVMDNIDTRETIIKHIDKDISDLVAIRNQILEEKC